MVALIRFEDDGPPDGAIAVVAALRRDGPTLRMRFELRGDLAALSIPVRSVSPRRADGLWQDTCFEVFLAPPGHDDYREVNLAPSGDWNVYRFASYRRDGQPDPDVTDLPITASLAPRALVVEAALAVPPSPLDAGLTAVVRDRAGAIGHWAVRHAGTRPDFHLRTSFVLRV